MRPLICCDLPSLLLISLSHLCVVTVLPVKPGSLLSHIQYLVSGLISQSLCHVEMQSLLL